jgi:hypothetical protein
MPRNLAAGPLLLLLLALPALAASQVPSEDLHRREGFWIAFGFGPAYLSVACDTCETTGGNDPWGSGLGMNLWLSMGGTASESVLLGGGFKLADLGGLAGGDGTDRSATLGALSFMVQYYPWSQSGIHFRGGTGFGFGSLSVGTGELLTAEGMAVQVGVGHDIRFGGRFGLTPFADISLNLSPERTTGFQDRLVGIRANPWHVEGGLGFAWY